MDHQPNFVEKPYINSTTPLATREYFESRFGLGHNVQMRLDRLQQQKETEQAAERDRFRRWF